MGASSSQESANYDNFMKTVKDEVKAKSVFQYQITHFKILNLEKKILPSFEDIQSVKIKKIMTSKRMADLKKTLMGLKTNNNESVELNKLTTIQQGLEQKLDEKRQQYQQILASQNTFKNRVSFLENLKSKKANLKHKSEFLEMKIMKIDYNKRFSIKVVKGFRPLEIFTNKKIYSQFIIKQRLENCDKCLDRLEKLYNLSLKYKLDTSRAVINKIETKIASLLQEKEKIKNLYNLDLIELNYTSSINQILDEVNAIKSESSAIIEDNHRLCKEIEGF